MVGLVPIRFLKMINLKKISGVILIIFCSQLEGDE